VLLHDERQPDAVNGRANQELHIVDHQWTVDGHRQRLQGRSNRRAALVNGTHILMPI